jgi:hypothetical protein
MCDFSRLKQSLELEWLPSGRQVEGDGYSMGEHFSRDPAGEVPGVPRPCAPDSEKRWAGWAITVLAIRRAFTSIRAKPGCLPSAMFLRRGVCSPIPRPLSRPSTGEG